MGEVYLVHNQHSVLHVAVRKVYMKVRPDHCSTLATLHLACQILGHFQKGQTVSDGIYLGGRGCYTRRCCGHWRVVSISVFLENLLPGPTHSTGTGCSVSGGTSNLPPPPVIRILYASSKCRPKMIHVWHTILTVFLLFIHGLNWPNIPARTSNYHWSNY